MVSLLFDVPPSAAINKAYPSDRSSIIIHGKSNRLLPEGSIINIVTVEAQTLLLVENSLRRQYKATISFTIQFAKL